MTDVVDAKTRSRMMSGIRATNTKPEQQIRKALYHRGFRYRINDKALPGKPDLVFRSRSAVILVHGCFWHGHDCHLFKWPKSRPDWWRAKIRRNQERDKQVHNLLQEEGWRIAEVWECALKGKTRLPMENVIDQLSSWLENQNGEHLVIRGFPLN